MGGGSANLNVSHSSKTPIGFAFNAALYQAIGKVAEALIEAPWSCRVGGATNDRVVIDCGAVHRIKKGMVFAYYSRNGAIKNEEGEVIGYDEEENGTATVTSVQKKAAVAKHTGDKPPKAGDAVVLVQKKADTVEANE